MPPVEEFATVEALPAPTTLEMSSTLTTFTNEFSTESSVKSSSEFGSSSANQSGQRSAESLLEVGNSSDIDSSNSTSNESTTETLNAVFDEAWKQEELNPQQLTPVDESPLKELQESYDDKSSDDINDTEEEEIFEAFELSESPHSAQSPDSDLEPSTPNSALDDQNTQKIATGSKQEKRHNLKAQNEAHSGDDESDNDDKPTETSLSSELSESSLVNSEDLATSVSDGVSSQNHEESTPLPISTENQVQDSSESSLVESSNVIDSDSHEASNEILSQSSTFFESSDTTLTADYKDDILHNEPQPVTIADESTFVEDNNPQKSLSENSTNDPLEFSTTDESVTSQQISDSGDSSQQSSAENSGRESIIEQEIFDETTNDSADILHTDADSQNMIEDHHEADNKSVSLTSENNDHSKSSFVEPINNQTSTSNEILSSENLEGSTSDEISTQDSDQPVSSEPEEDSNLRSEHEVNQETDNVVTEAIEDLNKPDVESSSSHETEIEPEIHQTESEAKPAVTENISHESINLPSPATDLETFEQDEEPGIEGEQEIANDFGENLNEIDKSSSLSAFSEEALAATTDSDGFPEALVTENLSDSSITESSEDLLVQTEGPSSEVTTVVISSLGSSTTVTSDTTIVNDNNGSTKSDDTSTVNAVISSISSNAIPSDSQSTSKPGKKPTKKRRKPQIQPKEAQKRQQGQPIPPKKAT